MLLIFGMGSSSCSSKKFLQEDEFLLKKNEIKIESTSMSADEKARLKELAYSRIFLRPNSNYIFFFPKERARLKYRFAADTPKVASFFMRMDSEEPALIDTSFISSIAENLELTLKSEGYYDAEATYEIHFNGKKNKGKLKKFVPVTYTLYPKKIYRLDGIELKSADTAILSEIHNIGSTSLLQKGAPVSSSLRATEAKRISDALRDKGYYDFSPAQFSRFIAQDTSNHEVDMKYIVYPPSDDSIFRKYTIGNIYIYPAFDADRARSTYRDTVIGDHHFRTTDGNTIMKPKFISEKIAFKSGDYYSYNSFRKTILQLNTLDIFKTPRISIEKRNDGSYVLDYHIQLFKEKKYTDQAGIENFLSSLSEGSLLLGASLSAGRSIKNAFKGSETVSLNLSGSVETAFSGSNDNDIITLGIGLDMQSPRYKDVLSLSSLRLIPGVRKNILTDGFMNDLNTLGSQSLNLSFNYVDFENFYSSTSIKFARGVNLNRNNSKFNFVFQEFNLFSPNQGQNFDDLIGDNEVFKRSFAKQLITGILFRSFSYSYNSPIKNKKSFDIFYSFESSGHEISLINALSGNALNSINFNGEDFTFSQFIKTEIEPKYTYYINNRSSLAFRLGIGAAFPFGTGDQVPYDELFSLGGSYSLRGWRNRDVGPGILNSSNSVIPFAADQFKLELSTEYRFDLGWILEGAIFGETGNVWNISDPTPDTKFNLESLAVDAGLGIRFDLTFFLFRFDTAYPLRNWYPDVNGKYWNTSSFNVSDLNYTIGINYPF